jgi:hypothetical protein
MDGYVYTMRTEKLLSGRLDDTFQVWEENSSGRATFDWKLGKSYLLFFYTKDNRGWVLDGCGTSGPLAKAQSALREIADFPKSHGGMIQVALRGDAISGVEVNARGTSGSFVAKTNAKGIAEIHVPEGEYSVTVPKMDVMTFDFSYDLPGKVAIENGSCAQIQLIQTSDSR